MPATDRKPRRTVCAACLRAQSACVCRWIVRAASAVEVLILQSPLEVANAKGTARLLHLCLPGSVLVAGEQFDEAALHALLYADAGTTLDTTPIYPVLLYPDIAHDGGLGIAGAPVLAAGFPHVEGRVRLVVLDGTWRKSRKMLYQNRLLQQLPRFALRAVPASRYAIRKAHLPDQLSTFEATCLALEQIDGDGARTGRMLAAFDGFVAQQAAHRPADCAGTGLTAS